MKSKFSVCALVAILLLSLLPTGCASGSRAASESLAASTLYQPPVLRLTAGVTVQTQDGRYTPATAETWHSDARFRQLEQENINLAAALQERLKQ